MVKRAIATPGHLGAIAIVRIEIVPIALGAMGETSDPGVGLRRRLPYLAEPRENNLAVLTHLRLERAEILPVINCSAE
jgi:hypothetical protein